MMVHHASCPEAPLLHLPTLVPSRQTSWLPPTGLRQARVPVDASPQEAGGVASAESGLLFRPADPDPWGVPRAAGTAPITLSFESTSLGYRAIRVRGARR